MEAQDPKPDQLDRIAVALERLARIHAAQLEEQRRTRETIARVACAIEEAHGLV